MVSEANMYILLEYSIEGAHFLPNVPAGHKCGALHGHSYAIRLEITGELGDDSGWIIDYADVRAVFDPVIMALDHQCLNKIAGLENPTCENLVLYLRRTLPELAGAQLSAIEIRETARAGAGWRA